MNKTIVEHQFKKGDVVYVRDNTSLVIKAKVDQVIAYIEDAHIHVTYTCMYLVNDIWKTVGGTSASVFATAGEAFEAFT